MMIVKDNQKTKATSKQKEFIVNLLEEMGREEDYQQYNVDNLTVSEAKELISQLIKERDEYWYSISATTSDYY